LRTRDAKAGNKVYCQYEGVDGRMFYQIGLIESVRDYYSSYSMSIANKYVKIRWLRPTSFSYEYSLSQLYEVHKLTETQAAVMALAGIECECKGV